MAKTDKKNDDLLAEARKRFRDAASAESENRASYVEDVEFENGKQWDDQVRREREGRPCLVINKTTGVVKKIVGDARQNRPSVKVRAVDSNADPQVAELLTGLIRNIENNSQAETAYDTGFENAARGGVGYWRVITDYAGDATFDQDIFIRRIVNPMSVFMDQSSVEADYSDIRYAFVTETLGVDEFKEMYPKAEAISWDSSMGESDADWFTEETVLVAEYWYKKPAVKEVFELMDGRTVEVESPQVIEVPGPEAIDTYVMGEGFPEPVQFRRSRKVKYDKVYWCKHTGAEVLEGPTEWAGKYIPIIPCLGEEVWIEGRRVLRSAIKFAKDPQRLYNWARSTAAETIAMAPKQPFIVTPEEIEGHEDQWAMAHAKPMPYLLHNASPYGRPTRQAGSTIDSGALQEAIQSADDIKATTGIYDASLGARGNETSGRAILARQSEGDTATFVFTDNQSRAIEYTGRILVDLIPKIYDTDRVVRLLNEDGSQAWGRINVLDPVTGQVIANDLSVGRYDVVVDAGPGYKTKRMEAAEGLVQLSQAAPQFAPILVPRIAKNLDWPEAMEIADEIRAMTQPQPQQPSPKDQIEMMKAQADTESKQADTAKTVAEVQGQQLENQKTQMEIYQTAAEMEAMGARIQQLEGIISQIIGVPNGIR